MEWGPTFGARYSEMLQEGIPMGQSQKRAFKRIERYLAHVTSMIEEATGDVEDMQSNPEEAPDLEQLARDLSSAKERIQWCIDLANGSRDVQTPAKEKGK